MATAIANGDQTTIPGTENYINNDQNAEKPKRTGNPLMRAVQPDYLTEPRPLEFADNMMSDDFCLEVGNKMLLQRLHFKIEKEWLAFCKQIWNWSQQAEEREIEAAAQQVLQQCQNNPKLLEALKRKLEE